MQQPSLNPANLKPYLSRFMLKPALQKEMSLESMNIKTPTVFNDRPEGMAQISFLILSTIYLDRLLS